MKKTAQKLLLVLGVTAVTFFSCKKEAIHSAPNEQMIASVNTWLEKQHDPQQPNRSKYLDILKKHLNFAGMQEIPNDHGNVVVIPMDNEFRSLTKVSDGSIPNLVVLVNKDGSIRNAHVAIYTAPKGQHVTELPASTFGNIYLTARNVTDGQYLFLSPGGAKQYQLEYKNGRMASEGRYTTTPKNSAAVQTNSVRVNALKCTDWYLTTTYYVDGVEVGETEEYLGRSCVGGLSDAPGDIDISPEHEYAKSYTKTWQVKSVNDSTSIYDTEAFLVQDDYFVTGVTFGTPQITHQPYGSTFAYSPGTGTFAFDYTWVTIYRNTSLTYSFDPAPVDCSGQQTWTVPQIKN